MECSSVTPAWPFLRFYSRSFTRGALAPAFLDYNARLPAGSRCGWDRTVHLEKLKIWRNYFFLTSSGDFEETFQVWWRDDFAYGRDGCVRWMEVRGNSVETLTQRYSDQQYCTSWQLGREKVEEYPPLQHSFDTTTFAPSTVQTPVEVPSSLKHLEEGIINLMMKTFGRSRDVRVLYFGKMIRLELCEVILFTDSRKWNPNRTHMKLEGVSALHGTLPLRVWQTDQGLNLTVDKTCVEFAQTCVDYASISWDYMKPYLVPHIVRPSIQGHTLLHFSPEEGMKPLVRQHEFIRLLDSVKRTVQMVLDGSYNFPALFEELLAAQGSSILPPICNQQLSCTVKLNWPHESDLNSSLTFQFSANDAYFIDEEEGSDGRDWVEIRTKDRTEQFHGLLRVSLKGRWYHLTVATIDEPFPSFDYHEDVEKVPLRGVVFCSTYQDENNNEDGRGQGEENEEKERRVLVFVGRELEGEILVERDNAVVTYPLALRKATLPPDRYYLKYHDAGSMKTVEVVLFYEIKQALTVVDWLGFPSPPPLTYLCGRAALKHGLRHTDEAVWGDVLPRELVEFLLSIVY